MPPDVGSNSLNEKRRRVQHDRRVGRQFRSITRTKRGRKILLRRLFAEYLDPRARGFIDFGDHGFFVDPRDQTVAFELLLGRGWQRAETEAVAGFLANAGLLPAGGAFVDVGANIGTQTVYALLGAKFARAVAVEPAPDNLDLLRRNIDWNNLRDRVAVAAVALSDQAGDGTLRLNPANAGGHSLEAAMFARQAGTLEVGVQRLDDVLADAGVGASDVGLVWIDVEGHEMPVLRGARSVMEAGVPICFEYSGKVYDAPARAELAAMLARHYRAAIDVEALLARPGDGPQARALAELLDDAQRDILVFNPEPRPRP